MDGLFSRLPGTRRKLVDFALLPLRSKAIKSFCFRFNGSVADRRNRVGRELANDFEKEAHDFAAGTAGLCMGSALTTRRRINSRFGFLCATMISE